MGNKAGKCRREIGYHIRRDSSKNFRVAVEEMAVKKIDIQSAVVGMAHHWRTGLKTCAINPAREVERK